MIGEPQRNRTSNLLIKSLIQPLLPPTPDFRRIHQKPCQKPVSRNVIALIATLCYARFRCQLLTMCLLAEIGNEG
jgi:hypothetical protein